MDDRSVDKPAAVEGYAQPDGQPLGVTPKAPPGGTYTHDNRYKNRKFNQKQAKAQAVARAAQKLERENAVLQGVAGGFTIREIARQLGISKSYVHDLYRSAMVRVQGEGIAEFKELMHFRLNMMLQSTWQAALGGDPRAMANALAICREMSSLEGAYPPPQLDVVGDITVRRELSLSEVMRTAAEIHAERVARGEAALPRVVLERVDLLPALPNGSEPPDTEPGVVA